MFRVGVLILLVSGCGKDFCDRASAVSEGCGQEVSDEDLAECREAIGNCSADDQKLLDDAFDCFEEADLLVCESEGDDTGTATDDIDDLGALFGCLLPLQSLSQECQGDLVITGGT